MPGLLSIKEILKKPLHQRTPQEQSVADSLSKALDRTQKWKQSGKPRVDGVLASVLDRMGLPDYPSNEESYAFINGRKCISALLEYYSHNRSKPVEAKAIVTIFKFTQANLHPSLVDAFGYFVTSLIREDNIPVTSRAKKLLENDRTEFIKSTVKEAFTGVPKGDFGNKKSKDLETVTSLEFDARVNPKTARKLVKKFLGSERNLVPQLGNGPFFRRRRTKP